MKKSNRQPAARTLALLLAAAAIAALAAAGCNDNGAENPNSAEAKTFLGRFDGANSPPPNTASYTVTFNSNGGSNVPSQTVTQGGTATLPANPTRSGYTFGGWYSNSGLTTAWDFNTKTVNANTTLYAKWTAVATATYTLTTSVSPAGSGTVSPASGSYEAGAQVTITAQAASGYAFSYWSGGASGSENTAMVTMDGNKSVTAVFVATSNPPPQVGTFVDPRDQKTYKKVTIGTQTWMAENLNYAAANSWCYDNAAPNCEQYGRLYTWEAAKTACPSGWRLPTKADWDALVNKAGGEEIAGKKLKSKTGWNDRGDGTSGNGTDEFGFSALPGGFRSYYAGSFRDVGGYGYWWGAAEDGSGYASNRGMGYYDGVIAFSNDERDGYSVRCVQNP